MGHYIWYNAAIFKNSGADEWSVILPRDDFDNHHAVSEINK